MYRQKVVSFEVIVKAGDEDFFKGFAEGWGKLDWAVRGNCVRRFIGFREHKGFGGFPFGRNEAGTKDECVYCSEEVNKDVW